MKSLVCWVAFAVAIWVFLLCLVSRKELEIGMLPSFLGEVPSALELAASNMIGVAVQGGIMIWGASLCCLPVRSTTDVRQLWKVAPLVLSLAMLAALFFAFWSYMIENPGETEYEAMHDAAMTFSWTPTVVHALRPSVVSTRTRVTAPVPLTPSTMRTL